MIPNTFTGTVIVNALTNTNVNSIDLGAVNEPPPPQSNRGGPVNIVLNSISGNPDNPFLVDITWDTNPTFPLSSSFNIAQLRTAIKNGVIPGVLKLEAKLNVRSGSQNATLNSRPTLTTYIYNTSSGVISPSSPSDRLDVVSLGPINVSRSVPYCYNNVCPDSIFKDITSYNASGVVLNPIPWDNNSAPAVNFDINQLTLDFEIKVTLTTTCTGADLVAPNGFCNFLCQIKENQEVCFTPYLGYCFGGTNGGTNIYTDPTCRTFFSNYINQVNPDKRIDEALNKYCVNKYGGGDDLSLISGVPIDQELCGCNMNQAAYDKFVSSLQKSLGIPQGTSFGIVDRCLASVCASSSFKTLKTGVPCPIPQCLNIAAVKIDGTIDNSSTVNVNQTAECLNVKSTNTNNTNNTSNTTKKTIINPDGTTSEVNVDEDGNIVPEEDESFFSKYKWYILIGGIILLILIIIIIVIAV